MTARQACVHLQYTAPCELLQQSSSVALDLLSPKLPGGHHGVGLSDEHACEAKHGNATVPVLSPAEKRQHTTWVRWGDMKSGPNVCSKDGG